jgi:hypothetical protein
VVEQFEEKYEAIGSLLGRLANDSAAQENVLGALSEVTRRAAEHGAVQIDPGRLALCVAAAPPSTNLRISFPLDSLCAIPCLAHLLATRSTAERVGGGSLSLASARSIPLISMTEDVPNHPFFFVDAMALMAASSQKDVPEPPRNVHTLEPEDPHSENPPRWWSWGHHLKGTPSTGPVREGFIHALHLALLFSIFLLVYSGERPDTNEQLGFTDTHPIKGAVPSDTVVGNQATSSPHFSPLLFQSDVIEPLVEHATNLRPDGLVSNDIRSSLLWQLKSQGGTATFLRADSSFSVRVMPNAKGFTSTWTASSSEVPFLLGDATVSDGRLADLNERLNRYGRATLTDGSFMMRGTDSSLEVVRH